MPTLNDVRKRERFVVTIHPARSQDVILRRAFSFEREARAFADRHAMPGRWVELELPSS